MSQQPSDKQAITTAQKVPEQDRAPTNNNVPIKDDPQVASRAPPKRAPFRSSTQQPLLQTRPQTPPAPLRIHPQSKPQCLSEDETLSSDSGNQADDEDSLFDRRTSTEGGSYIERPLDICDKMNNTMFCREGEGVCVCRGDCCLCDCVVM